MKTSQFTNMTSSQMQQSQMQQSSRSSHQAFEKDYPRFDNLDPSLDCLVHYIIDIISIELFRFIITQLQKNIDGGFKILFIQELPIKIQQQIKQQLLEGIDSLNETTNVEPVLIKLMQKVNSQQQIQQQNSNCIKQKQLGKEKRVDTIKIELTTEADLFFNFVFEANDTTFLRMKKKQKWNIDFDQLSSSIINMFTSCQNDPYNFQLTFEINKELNGELIISQNTEFKHVELMKLDFVTASQEIVRQSVIYRYNLVKAKLMISTSRVNDTFSILQEKNPTLCEYVKKNTSMVRAKQYSPNY